MVPNSIVAARVPKMESERKNSNTIVREGTKNSTVWALVGFYIYKANPEAPWWETFEVVSTFLKSLFQEGIDPYTLVRRTTDLWWDILPWQLTV